MDPQLTQWLIVFATYFVLLPALTFLSFESKHRRKWVRRVEVPVAECPPGGPFRDDLPGATTTRYKVTRYGAPAFVKVTVVTSLVLGHMFIPGLLLGLFGLIAYAMGLISIPGLILAARIYDNAFGLLRCDLVAAVQARELKRFALTLNVVVLCIAIPLALATLGDDLALVFLGTSVYAAISITHAYALGVAADAVEDAVKARAMQPCPQPTREANPLAA